LKAAGGYLLCSQIMQDPRQSEGEGEGEGEGGK
jgi:hypothetical protein